MLDAQLPRPDTHVHKNESAFLISLYAVADKYDVPRLRSLILERLNETCNTQHVPTFIDALLVVEQYTSDNAVWDILMPKIKQNLGTLLKNEAFRDVIMSQPAMTLQLLGSFASGAQLPGHSPPGSFTSTHPMSTSTVRGYAAGLRGARGGRGGRGARGISS